MSTTLWRKREESAVIINDSGSAVICDHCPCCDGVVEFDRELAHAYDSVPVKVTVTLQPGCFDKDGVTSASLYFTSTVYADESRITVLFEEARRYTLGSAGSHPVPDEYSVNPITGVVKYAWYFYVSPEEVTSIFVNLVQPKGELEDNLSYAEIAYSSDVKLEVDSADDEPCVGDYISHSFTFSPTEALAGYGIVISLIYFPAVEATVTTDGDVELSDHIPTDLAGEMGWGPLYIVVPGLIHIEYANSDTEQELGEYTIVPGSTISVSAPTLNTCGDGGTLSITITCLAEAKAEAVTIEVYDGEYQIGNIGDYIEESGGAPFSFGTGWIYDSGTATYSFSKEVVALPRNSAASLSIVAKVEVPSSVEDTNPISSEGILSIYLPDTQVSITAPTLDLYKGVGTLKIVVFCVDENDFTPPSVSFSMGGTLVDINDYAEWDDESMINFAAGNWVISGGDATWEYDLEANDRADPGDAMTITVTYLGVDYTGTITFDVEGTLSVTIPSMHRYGVDKIISVEIVNAPRAWSGTPSFTKNGSGAFSDHVQWMTSASWDASTWLRTARGIGEGTTFSVDVEYMKLPAVTKTVTIDDEVLCSGGIAADQVYSGGAITLTAEISASEKLVQARLPTPSTSLVSIGTGTVEFKPFDPAQWSWEMDEEEGVLSFLGSVLVEGEGTVEFKIFLGTSESGVLLEGCTDTCDVVPSPVAATFVTCPTTLHTLGVAKAVSATVEYCPVPSFRVVDTLGEPTEDVTILSADYSGVVDGSGTITCSLQAIETATVPATVKIQILCGSTVYAEENITLTDVLQASVTMPSTACLGEPLSGIQIFIGGADGEYTPRFVYGIHAIVAQECDPEGAITLAKSGTDPFWTDVDAFVYLSGGVWQWGDTSATEVAQSISGTYLTELPATVTLTVEQIRAGEANTEISGGGDSVSITYDVTITGPGNMHVAGCSKQLTIKAPCYEHAGLPDISVFYLDDQSDEQSFHSFIGGDGSVVSGSLDFDGDLWKNGEWSYALRISSVSAYNPITIRASKYMAVVAETTFSTSGAYRATIGPSMCYVGKPFSLHIDIDGIPNIPLCYFSGSYVTVSEDGPSTGSNYGTGWSSSGSWTNNAAQVDDYDSNGVYISIYDAATAALIASHIIEIRPAGVYIDILSSPNSLHVYGESKTLSVSVNIDGYPPGLGMPEKCSVTLSGAGSGYGLSDYLEMEGGASIDLSSGWIDGTWTGSVRAKTSAEEASLTLTFTYTYGELTESESTNISISRMLDASISAPSRVAPEEGFTTTITVSSTVGTLTRLPSTGGVTIAHGNEDGSGSPTMMSGGAPVSFSSFVDGVCTVSGCSIESKCSYEIEITHDDIELDGCTINVTTDSINLTALAEAISERRVAKGDAAYSPPYSTNLGTWRSRANTAVSGFIQTVNSDGTYTLIPSNPVQARADFDSDQAWIDHAYGIVCGAVKRSGGRITDNERWAGYGSYTSPERLQSSKCCEDPHDNDMTGDDKKWWCPTKSLGATESKAKSVYSSDWGRSSSVSNTGYAYAWSKVDYCIWFARMEGGVRRLRVKCTSTVNIARKVKYYASHTSEGGLGPFGGHNIPSETGSMWMTGYAAAGSAFEWTQWHAPSSKPMIGFGFEDSNYAGYAISVGNAILEFQFRHR